MTQELNLDEINTLIDTVEHPEIAATLVNLGMILDTALDGDELFIAMALPAAGVPQNVREALETAVAEKVSHLGLRLQVDFFLMSPEGREQFMALARANWKGAI